MPTHNLHPRRTSLAALAGTGLLLLGSGLLSAPAASAADPADQFTVMSRNLFIGMDVGKTLDILTQSGSLEEAAAYAWGEVQETDMLQRAPLLAQEIIDNGAAVVGLQEATLWECADRLGGTPQPLYDFTNDLIEALAAKGAAYQIAKDPQGAEAVQPGFAFPPVAPVDMNGPAPGGTQYCGFTMRDAVLVRGDVQVAKAQSGTFTNLYNLAGLPAPIGALDVQRSWASVDATLGGRDVRFVTFHLESFDAGDLRAAQIQEVLDGPVAQARAEGLPVIMVGDFNSDPRDPRPAGTPNPGGQPQFDNPAWASSDISACPDQPNGSAEVVIDAEAAKCNSYWTARLAGMKDAGPDIYSPANYTWGWDSDLTAPDGWSPSSQYGLYDTYFPATPEEADALPGGRDAFARTGLSDRLDFALYDGDLAPVSARVIGNDIVSGPTWTSPFQDNDDGAAPTATETRLPTDHAGLVATFSTMPPAAALPPTAPRDRSLVVAPGSVAPGGTVQVSAPAGTFWAGSPVVVGLYTDPVQLAQVAAGADGSLSAEVTIPQDNAIGEHTIAAFGQEDFDPEPEVSLAQTIEVEAPAPSVPTGIPAGDGAARGPASWLSTALVMLLAGAATAGAVIRRPRSEQSPTRAR